MRRVFGVVAALLLTVSPMREADAQTFSAQPAAEDFSAVDADFLAGRVGAAVAALQQAADRGRLAAMLRLAQLYQEGALVPQDKLKACRLYSAAVERFSKVDRFSPGAPLVAEAFRRCAECYAVGLSVPGWDRNMSMAADLLFQAGVILEDPASLFELSNLYLRGEGVEHNTTLAIRLLENAARKRYPPAQALLGWLMWEGKVMKERAAPGLALLILAMERTAPEHRSWIASYHDDAMLLASKDIEQEALGLVEKWKSVYQIASGPSEQPSDIPPPVKSPAREAKAPNLNRTFGAGTDRFSNQPTGADVPPATAAKSN